MQSKPVLDIDRLAAPIPGDAPTGVDLRVDHSATLWEIKDARKKARGVEDALDKGEQPDQKNPLDWGKVLHPCLRVLEDKTKDLEIAAYVIESALRLHGVAGLRDGFRLTRKLVETYWDDLYPSFELEPDPPNPEPRKSAETRVTFLSGLNSGALKVPVERLVVARSPRLGDFTFIQYKDALGRKREAELETIQRAAAETATGFYQELSADLTASVEEFTRMTVALDERCGRDSPHSSTMSELLDALAECVRKLAGDRLNQPAAPAAAVASTQPAEGSAKPASGGGGPDVLRTREDAFHTLQKVADFFRRNDPHSLLAYALEQVIRWGKLPLPELLGELISQEDSRRELFKQVGIKPPEEKSTS